MALGANIRYYRDALGYTLEELSDLSGVDVGTISALENRDSSRSKYAAALARALRVPLEQLHSDEVGAIEQEQTRFLAGSLATDVEYPSLQPILAWDHPDDLPEGEFVMVPKLDIKLSAGNGHEQLEINLTRSTPLAFRASWVREKRLKPSKLAAMTATGNSMEPGIFDGDSLVVDTSQIEVLDGKVYALWYDGGERVKRLYRLPGGGLRIKSDNPDHPPIEVQPEKLEHVRILGRVVHRSGDGGL